MNNKIPTYQQVNNRPIGCHFCGSQVNGKILETRNPITKEPVKECRWVCDRCGNLVKIGTV